MVAQQVRLSSSDDVIVQFGGVLPVIEQSPQSVARSLPGTCAAQGAHILKPIEGTARFREHT